MFLQRFLSWGYRQGCRETLGAGQNLAACYNSTGNESKQLGSRTSVGAKERANDRQVISLLKER